MDTEGKFMLKMIRNSSNHIVVMLDNLQKDAIGAGRIVLYGAGYCGHEALSQLRNRNLPVFAVCDDARVGQELDGFPITDISLVKPGSDLKIFVTSGFNEKMIQKLERLGLIDYYVEADFGRFEPEKENYDFFKNHQMEIESAYDLLEDDYSKSLYVNLINYRISRDHNYMNGMRELSPQYYPDEPDLRFPINSPLKSHVFMDLGAYDGDSIRDFLTYVGGQYKQIIAVEASEKNYERLKDNCMGMHDVECINIGIADRKKEMRFSMSDAKNSFTSSEGESVLQVDSVDNILRGREVSYIKMDIEGAEFEAIKGANKTIREYMPIMAISVYHLTEDLFRILLLIEEIIQGRYKFYLRHYSPTMIETILYAVPRV